MEFPINFKNVTNVSNQIFFFKLYKLILAILITHEIYLIIFLC